MKNRLNKVYDIIMRTPREKQLPHWCEQRHITYQNSGMRKMLLKKMKATGEKRLPHRAKK